MSEIKSLADRLRSQIASAPEPQKKKSSKSDLEKTPEILKQIIAYDNSNHKSMVHARFDDKTAQMLAHFKMATGVDTTKLVAFSIKHLFQQYPELKSLIKQFIQNLEL